jgi:cytochrome c6
MSSRRAGFVVGAVVVVALAVGVALSVASATATDPPEVTAGRDRYVAAGCGACHVLADAGTTGRVGPNLDRLMPSEGDVRRAVTEGAPGMPSYAGRLDADEIDRISGYVASRSR